MGMLDSNLIFCEAQAVTATGDTPSTNVYDTGNGNGSGDAGLTGENLWINAVCTTAVTSDGSATVQAVLQSSADNTTFTDVVAGLPIAKASLLAGTVMLMVQPPPGMLEYWRVVWRVGTAALTAGAFDAWVSNTIQDNVSRNSGFSVN
jgi:hypothetical protein